MTAVVHIAGPAQMGGLYQACSRCGYVLQDYTGQEMAWMDADDTGRDPGPGRWCEGILVAVSDLGGGCRGMYVVPSRQLDGDETECRPAS